MVTVFDIVTVVCFVGLVAAFFKFTDQESGTLLQFLVPAVVLAVANQVGNAGWIFFASALIAAGLAYALLIVRQRE